jgi:predicted DNA binding protein
MSLVAEFDLSTETFVLRDILERDGTESIEFACNMPTRLGAMPYFWVWGSSFDGIQETMLQEPSVREIKEIDALENSRLYRAEWGAPIQELLGAVQDTDGLFKTAVGKEQWEFEMIFKERDDLSAFSRRSSDIGLDFQLSHVHALTEPIEDDYGLTPPQKEALITAEQNGYFNQPRNVTMDELADEMGLSPGAVSGRLRRGCSNLIQRTLLSSS